MDNYLKTQRRRLGLTQGEVAALLNISSGGALSRYEKGCKAPNLKTALRLSILYQTSFKKLFPKLYEELEYQILNNIDCMKSSDPNADEYQTKQLQDITNKIVKRNNQL